ncbi:hypothetical protein EJG51_016975 [Undibacterium piscinae]|uniref:DUF4124 domain-containing protein n=1 Tax=Undibacterium piscinae TaxID=2495591 RepID=A0A6M4A7G7_9BURK|nr:hypothetical protein EJG51_016975 [Undibacterium piscinae]
MKISDQRGAVSLFGTAILMMLLTIAGMLFLYSVRYGHLPFQDAISRWGRSANVISNELKQASGITATAATAGRQPPAGAIGQGSAGTPAAATIDAGIRRCTIHGKIVYSDNECRDDNVTTRAVKLQDSRSDAPKPAPTATDGNEDTEQSLRMKMIDKAINRSAH